MNAFVVCFGRAGMSWDLMCFCRTPHSFDVYRLTPPHRRRKQKEHDTEREREMERGRGERGARGHVYGHPPGENVRGVKPALIRKPTQHATRNTHETSRADTGADTSTPGKMVHETQTAHTNTRTQAYELLYRNDGNTQLRSTIQRTQGIRRPDRHSSKI